MDAVWEWEGMQWIGYTATDPSTMYLDVHTYTTPYYHRRTVVGVLEKCSVGTFPLIRMGMGVILMKTSVGSVVADYLPISQFCLCGYVLGFRPTHTVYICIW